MRPAGAWFRRHRVATGVAGTVFFVVTDVLATLSGATWWPARPGTLAW